MCVGISLSVYNYSKCFVKMHIIPQHHALDQLIHSFHTLSIDHATGSAVGTTDV